MNHSEGCTICGEELEYSQEPFIVQCQLCERRFESDVRCVSGHFVCDACHRLGAIEYIERFCVQSSVTDPLELAISLMKHPTVKMHGPEHHYLVPAVLISAYYNRIHKPEKKKLKLRIARKRAEIIPGGYCGSHGACGAGIGTGVFMSVITESTPLKKEEWKWSNRLTSEALLKISEHGGPRCCKRDSFIAIEEAVRFLREKTEVEIPLKKISCSFYGSNKECLLDQCSYFPGS